MAMLKQERHWFDYVVFGIRAVWGILGVISLCVTTDVSIIMLIAGTVAYILSCCAPFALYLMKRVPRYVPVIAELLFIGVLYLLIPVQDTVFSFFQIPAFTLGYLASGWNALWALAVIGIYPFLLSGGIPDFPIETIVDALVNLGILFGFGFCFHYIVTSYQKINHMYGIIQEQNQTLEVYAKEIEKLTLLEERSRLSRELHDTVGHTFTTTITGMDAVYYLIDLSPEEAKKNMRELLQITRSGLDEVRRHIHQIAPDRAEQSLARSLMQIGDQFAAHTGTQVSLYTEGDEYPVSEQVRLTFIRCMQESLTNAKKHGKATVVHVTLAFESEQISLRIKDNGMGDANLSMGFGLKTMTDRLNNINGSLHVTSSAENGTVVQCLVPVFNVERKQISVMA